MSKTVILGFLCSQWGEGSHPPQAKSNLLFYINYLFRFPSPPLAHTRYMTLQRHAVCRKGLLTPGLNGGFGLNRINSCLPHSIVPHSVEGVPKHTPGVLGKELLSRRQVYTMKTYCNNRNACFIRCVQHI